MLFLLQRYDIGSCDTAPILKTLITPLYVFLVCLSWFAGGWLQITAELGLHDVRDRVWQILPCSARTGEGLQEGMEWLVEQVNSKGVSK